MWYIEVRSLDTTMVKDEIWPHYLNCMLHFGSLAILQSKMNALGFFVSVFLYLRLQIILHLNCYVKGCIIMCAYFLYSLSPRGFCCRVCGCHSNRLWTLITEKLTDKLNNWITIGPDLEFFKFTVEWEVQWGFVLVILHYTQVVWILTGLFIPL